MLFRSVPQSQSEVKSVIADGMDEESAEKYFEKLVGEIVEEFVLMSKLKGNSHIVSYEDHNVVKNPDKIEWDIFIRMEKLTGLIDFISKNKIVKKDIIKLGIDICKALELCQKYNIVHRDIKPENIFVSESGDYKLGDFGIARQVEKTMAGLSKKGTFTYIAPEVYKGEAYGSTVDIYSLGIVMYRFLNNNRTPFMPEYPKPITHNNREISLVKRMSGIVFPKPVNADGRLAEIVLKACEYEPKNRYNSPLLMRIELESILYNEAEGRIIYPKGDTADIKSINYINTGEETTRTQTMFVKDISNEETEFFPNVDKPKANRKAVYAAVGLASAVLIGSAGYVLWRNTSVNEADIIKEPIEKTISEEISETTTEILTEETTEEETTAQTTTIQTTEVQPVKQSDKTKETVKPKSATKSTPSQNTAPTINNNTPSISKKEESNENIAVPENNNSGSVQEQQYRQPVQEAPKETPAEAPNEAPEIMVDFD